MKRSTIYALFAICLLAAIVAPAYFGYTYFIKQGEVEALERDLSLERTKLELLRQKGKAVDVADSQTLQTRVPTAPALDTVVEALSQASLLAGVDVTSIAFADGLVAESEVPETVEPFNPADVSETNEPAEPTDVAPVNASTIRSTVTLQAETYDALVSFLESIESMNRIHVLRTIQFTGPTETGPNTVEEVQALDFTVELDAFYRPDLDQLVPDRYIPEPAFEQKDIPVYDYTTP
jgi:type IV pilus assembly protein PilO